MDPRQLTNAAVELLSAGIADLMVAFERVLVNLAEVCAVRNSVIDLLHQQVLTVIQSNRTFRRPAQQIAKFQPFLRLHHF